MRKSYVKLLFLFLSFTFFNSLFSQVDSVSTVKLELSDGSILIGKIISEKNDSLFFRTNNNIEIAIRKNQIINRSVITGKLVGSDFWYNDPNYTRLFFAPTGKALKAGRGYFAAYEIFFPFFAIGVTDYLSLAGGMSLIPAADGQIAYIAPKLTFYQTPIYSISGGVLYIKIPDEPNAAGILYSVSTINFTNSSLTAGLGFGFSGGDFAKNPILVLGWETRTSKTIKIITENWIFFGGETHLISFGIRFFGENVAADFGLIYPTSEESDGFPFLP